MKTLTKDRLTAIVNIVAGLIWLFVLALFLAVGTGCSDNNGTGGIFDANKDCYRSSPYFDKEKCRDNALNQRLIPGD